MFVIRPARAEDVPRIETWTRETFAWGDYVAEAMPEWLEDPESLVIVCVYDDDIPVALSRTQLLSPTEAWLSGARVHPDHRRSGMGMAMNDFGLDWARDRGALVARLATEEENEPARSQVLKLGYRLSKSFAPGFEEFRGDPDFEGFQPDFDEISELNTNLRLRLLSNVDFVDRPLDELRKRAQDDLRASQDKLRELAAQVDSAKTPAEVVDEHVAGRAVQRRAGDGSIAGPQDGREAGVEGRHPRREAETGRRVVQLGEGLPEGEPGRVVETRIGVAPDVVGGDGTERLGVRRCERHGLVDRHRGRRLVDGGRARGGLDGSRGEAALGSSLSAHGADVTPRGSCPRSAGAGSRQGVPHW